MTIFSGKKRRQIYKKQYGNNPANDPWHYLRLERLDLIRLYHDNLKAGTVDAITWDDLEMDDVFFRINHTRSYAGEQVLYHRLHGSSSETDWNEFERRIEFFDQHEEKRVIMEDQLAGIGKAQTSYHMPVVLNYLCDTSVPRMALYRMLQFLFFASLAGVIVLKMQSSIVSLVIIACLNLVIYVREKSKAEGTLSCIQDLFSILEFCRYINKTPLFRDMLLSPALITDIKRLKHLRFLSGHFLSKKMTAQVDPQGLIADYIFGITLWDLASFNKIVKIVKDNKEAIMRLFEFAGNIDITISIASYRKSIAYHCIPVFSEDNAVLADNLIHPLVPDAVPNSIILDRHTIIMGANASGKSTFIKAVALNIILAQTIHTCVATRFVLPSVQVVTSMAVRDHINAGESFYVREVKNLKRMLVEIEKGKLVFCIIDEILKGTNTAERLAAAEAVLRYLSEQKCMFLNQIALLTERAALPVISKT